MEGKKRAHVFVGGMVQGVYFRDSTRAQAERRGVTGWVRNLGDGRVEAVFEGEAAAVDALVDWCRRGPPGAHVVHVEVLPEAYRNEYSDFVVERTRR